MEVRDIKCCDGGNLNDKKTCFDGNGKYYVAGKYDKKDTLEKMLNKIIFLSRVDDRIVKWRRCMIGAIISTLFIFPFILPIEAINLKIFPIMCLTIFIVFYMIYNYYKFHFDVFPSGYIRENIKGIKRKLGTVSEEKIPSDIKTSVSNISGITIPTTKTYRKRQNVEY